MPSQCKFEVKRFKNEGSVDLLVDDRVASACSIQRWKWPELETASNEIRIYCYEFNLSRRNIKPMNFVVPWRWEKARVDGCEVPAKQRSGCAGFKEQRTVWIEASGGRRDSVVTWHVRVARVNAHVSTIYHLLFARFLRKIGAGYKDSDHLVPSFSVWRTPAVVALLFICPENQFFDTWRDVACIFLAYTFRDIFPDRSHFNHRFMLVSYTISNLSNVSGGFFPKFYRF